LVYKTVVVHWVAVAIARTTVPATIAVPAAATIPAPVRPVVAAVVGCVITSGIASGPKFAFHAGARIKAFAFPTLRGVGAFPAFAGVGAFPALAGASPFPAFSRSLALLLGRSVIGEGN
jgi:hypothetical protein